MNVKNNNSGFTLVELMIVVALFLVLSGAGFMTFVSGQSAWAVTNAKIDLQDNLRKTLQRVSFELQESGIDSSATLQVFISDNTGTNNTDIIRFAVPLCPCGVSSINSNGDIRYWGAPLSWGQAGCSGNYTLTNNNKVDICHLPPGNPTNTQSLSVNENAVKAHLAHDDYLGDCNACTPANNTNRWIEYRINSSGQLLRRVLDSSLLEVSSQVFADNISDFQTTINGDQTAVTMTVNLNKVISPTRTITNTGSLDIKLRNQG